MVQLVQWMHTADEEQEKGKKPSLPATQHSIYSIWAEVFSSHSNQLHMHNLKVALLKAKLPH